MEDLHERWGRTCVPVQLPITGPEGFHGVVDLVTMQAFYYETNGNGAGRIGEAPGHMLAAARTAQEWVVELVAEGKDELMEEFYAEGTIPEQHLITALHEAIREDRIFPVLFVSGETNVATDHLLDFFKVYAPAPIEHAPIAVHAPLMASVSNGHANGGAAVANGDTSAAATSVRTISDSE